MFGFEELDLEGVLEPEVSFFGTGELFRLFEVFLSLSSTSSFEAAEAVVVSAVSFEGTGEECPLLRFSLCLFSGLGEVDGVCAAFTLGAGVDLWLLGEEFLCFSPLLLSGLGEDELACEASFFGAMPDTPLLGDGFLCLSPLFSGLGELDGVRGISLFAVGESVWLRGDDFLCLSPRLCSGLGEEEEGWHGGVSF